MCDGSASTVGGFVPSQCHALVVKVYYPWLSGFTGRLCKMKNISLVLLRPISLMFILPCNRNRQVNVLVLAPKYWSDENKADYLFLELFAKFRFVDW